MTATIMQGRPVADAVEAAVRDALAGAPGWAPPRLAVVLCNDDGGSATYVGHKGRAAERVGIRAETVTPPLTSTTEELVSLVRGLDADPDIDAILVQLPLMPHVDQQRVVDCVSPQKDVDGFHPGNLGLLAAGAPLVTPCTPAGCMALLRSHDIPVAGRRAVVLGRSIIVGRPMALLLLNADATVTICHSRTPDVADVCREADIVVAAIGRPGTVDGSYIRPGAAVIDVGTTRVDGKLRGDVDRASVEPLAGWLTPVPGGVGPMTIAMLMRNALALAAARRPEGAPGVPA